MDPAIRTSLLCRSLIRKVGEATMRCEYSARLVFRPCWGEGRLRCFATVFVFTKAPNVDRRTSETNGATLKDAQTEAFVVRIPIAPTVIIPLSLPEVNKIMLIEVASRSEAWVYGRSLAGIAGSNTAGDMDVLSLVSVCECCVLAGSDFSAWG